MRRVLLLPILLLAPACSSDPGPHPPGQQLDNRPEPTPFDSDVDGSLEPSLTTDQVAALVPSVVGEALTIAPDAVIAVYNQLAARADAGCPEVTTVPAEEGEGTTVIWYGEEDCASADGTRFNGDLRFSTYTITEDDLTLDVVILDAGTVDIHNPDGTFLRGSGSVSTATGTFADGGTMSSAYFQGRLNADTVTAAGHPWLEGTMEGEVALQAFAFGEARTLFVGGSFPSRDASVSAVQFQELMIDSAACSLNASGVVALRDNAGGWHDADFGDAPEEEDTPDPNQPCDACGDLMFGGTSIGSFCGDGNALTNLLNWETQPW